MGISFKNKEKNPLKIVDLSKLSKEIKKRKLKNLKSGIDEEVEEEELI